MTRPVIAFGFEADRDALIEASAPGDMIVFVGTMDEPTAQDDRGRLLGIAEFARIPVNAADLIEPRAFKSFELKPDGSLISAKALPMLRAWSLNPKLKLLDVLQEELSVEATLKAVLLNQADSSVVLAIPRIEVTIPRSPMIDRLWVLSEASTIGRPTTGPTPTSWKGTISREANQQAWTYALRFGNRDVWKIGHTQDVSARLAQVNQHVPHEELTEQWILFLQQYWSSSQQAYSMEQRVFAALEQFRTQGERVRCPEHTLQSIWIKSLIS
jgi:hypothetical protein